MIKRIEPATPLPWHTHINAISADGRKSALVHADDPHVALAECFEQVWDGEKLADANVNAVFITEACNAYPRLMEERERLAEALSQATEALAIHSRALFELTDHLEGAKETRRDTSIEINGYRDLLASLEKDNG